MPGTYELILIITIMGLPGHPEEVERYATVAACKDQLSKSIAHWNASSLRKEYNAEMTGECRFVPDGRVDALISDIKRYFWGGIPEDQ